MLRVLPYLLPVAALGLVVGLLPGAAPSRPCQPGQMEALGRGLIALHASKGRVSLSWRLLGTDPEDTAFDVYRRSGDDAPVKLNDRPLSKATHFIDTKA